MSATSHSHVQAPTATHTEEMNCEFQRSEELKDGVPMFVATSADGAMSFVLRRTSRPSPMWLIIETEASHHPAPLFLSPFTSFKVSLGGLHSSICFSMQLHSRVAGFRRVKPNYARLGFVLPSKLFAEH